MGSRIKLNARQKAIIKAEIAQKKQNARLQNDATTLLGGVFGNYPMGVSPLSQPYQLAYDSTYAPVSLNRILLTFLYITHGVVQTVIDQPIEDSFRGGLDIKCDELDSEDLKLFGDYLDYFLIPAIKDTLRWAALFGGSGLIINTDQDPTTPLDEDAISEDTPLSFIPADRWEILLNFLIEDKVECPYNYYGQRIHKTRVIKVNGKEAPSFARRRLQGWGMSEIERLVRASQLYTKNEDVLFELIDEAKIDVFGIDGYNNSLLQGKAKDALTRRFQDISMGKNYHNAVVIDKEDVFEQKQISLSGLADIFVQLRVGMAAAAKMPVTKLFGLSAAGFNSGEDDIENYNSMVESGPRANARKLLIETIPLACRQMFGTEVEIDFEFKPLRILSAEQEENVKNLRFNRISALYAQGMYTSKEYYEKLRREGLEDMDTEVGKGIREAEPPQAPMSITNPQEPAETKSTKSNSLWGR